MHLLYMKFSQPCLHVGIIWKKLQNIDALGANTRDSDLIYLGLAGM